MKSFLALLILSVSAGCIPSRQQYDHRHLTETYRTAIPDARRTLPVGIPETLPIPTNPLGLEQAVRIALANNPEIRTGVIRIRRASAMLAMADAAFLPLVDGRLEYVRADAPSAYLFKKIDQREFASTTDFNDPGLIANVEVGLDARLNLFNGGRDVMAAWQAACGRQVEELDADGTRNALTAAVISAWYDIAAAEEMIVTTRQSVETVTAQREETAKKLALGGQLTSDLLTLDVRLAEAKEHLIRATTGQALAVAALANLLGGDADTPISIDRTSTCPCVIPVDYQAALALALRHRPELAAVRTRIEAAAMGVDAAAAAWLPQLDATAGAWFDDADLRYQAHEVNWRLGVGLRWNLFSGGSTLAEEERARTLLHEALETDRQMTLRVQLDVKRAWLHLQDVQARREVTEASVAVAEESLNLVRQQFTGGTATVTRYLEAETMLTRARMTRTQAHFALKKATAEAARSIGTYASHGPTDDKESK